jgi:hypothetical protein
MAIQVPKLHGFFCASEHNVKFELDAKMAGRKSKNRLAFWPFTKAGEHGKRGGIDNATRMLILHLVSQAADHLDRGHLRSKLQELDPQNIICTHIFAVKCL